VNRASRAAHRREDARVRARLNVEVWFPKARDLALPHVPNSERPRIRKRLSPWLANLKHGVKSGWCWKLAQLLALTAQEDDVKYVEGVWSRTYELESGERPVPHAWVTVEGYRVDLVGEFFSWRCGDNEWDYEPLKEYSQTELAELAFDLISIDLSPALDSTDLSTYVWSNDGGYETLPDHLKSEPQFKTQVLPPSKDYPNGLWGSPEEREALNKFWEMRNEYENRIVFGPAIDRLTARYSSEAVSK
jgi:hypothetical protein